MNGLAIMNLAHAIAVVAHEGQSRKGLGEPYINHVERVADGVYGWKAKSVAYLHDVVEDTDITLDDLKKIGIPDELLYCVEYLTRTKGEPYEDFISAILNEGNEIMIKVKISDINDNLHDIDSTDMPKKKVQYLKALAELEGAINGE